MKINFDTVMNDLDGVPLKEGEKPVTLKKVAVNALMTPFQDEANLSGEEKLTRYLLAGKVNPGGEVDLTPEEVSKLKMVIGKAYTPLVVGGAYAVLNS